MSTHEIGFNEDLKKNIFQLSSYMHLFSSPDVAPPEDVKQYIPLFGVSQQSP